MLGLARTAAERPRLGIVAAYPSVRAGLRALLGEGDRFEIVGEAVDPRELVAEASGGIDAVIVDLDSDFAWEAALDALASTPEIGLVVLGPASPASNEARLPAALGERAWGYLLKEAGAAELAQAIEAVIQGLVVLQPPLAQRLLSPPALGSTAGANTTAEGLTGRELEVLQLIAQGLPNKLIATQLGISEHTVKFHISAIFAKLGAASRTEAVRLGARRGLIIL